MKGRSNNREERSGQRSGSHSKGNYNSYNILPSSRILEEYEAIAPGSVGKLVDMAKKEQEHRHSWQDRYLNSHNITYRSGQLFGAVYNLLLLYVIYDLSQTGNKLLAFNLFLINALLIGLAIVVTFTERKLTTRKPPRRSGSDAKKNPQRNNRNFNNPSTNNRSPRDNRDYGNRNGGRTTHDDKGDY
jgi:uncharacterized membrane protein